MALIGLLLLHLIADFFLQTRKMGRNKSKDVNYLAGHLAIQFLVFTFGIYIFTDFVSAFLFSLCNAAIHGIIDWNIWRLYGLSVLKRRPRVLLDKSEFKFWEDHWFYCTIGVDQFLHSATIITLFYIFFGRA